MIAAALGAQSASFHRIAAPVRPYHPVWDAAKQRTVFLRRDGLQLVMPEWDGVEVTERQQTIPTLNAYRFVAGPRPGHLTLFEGTWSVHTWNGASWQHRSPTPPLGLNLGAASFSWDRQRRRLVGITRDNDRVYEWDGVSWTTIQPQTGPLGRVLSGWTYDPTIQQCVRYGGMGAASPYQVADDLWGWNGTSWSLLLGSAPPGPRAACTFGWSSTLQALVLTGGSTDANATLNPTTWMRSGSTWQRVSTTANPPPQFACEVVDDPLGAVCLAQNDLWRFDGSDWRIVHRFVDVDQDANAAVAFDRIRGQSLVFPHQGSTGGALFDRRWREITAPGPPPRLSHAMCWSPADAAGRARA